MKCCCMLVPVIQSSDIILNSFLITIKALTLWSREARAPVKCQVELFCATQSWVSSQAEDLPHCHGEAPYIRFHIKLIMIDRLGRTPAILYRLCYHMLPEMLTLLCTNQY